MRLRRALTSLLAAALLLPGVTGAAEVESRWGSNYFPNVELTTHEGKKVRFFDDCIDGKVVAINFIYTTCPDACPLETARMTEVQQILGDRVGKDVFFYSITIDPEIDTPEVLADYAQRYRTGPGWTFLTGRERDITLLRQKLGLYIPDIQSDDSKDHNINLIIGNQTTGRWMKRSPFENAHVLARHLGSWLHNWKEAPVAQVEYDDAPKLRVPDEGEKLFRTRCQSCHTVGQGDVARTAALVGPDLFMVTERRDRDWLRRWIAVPDEMLAEKDPIAMALFDQYDQVAMPNMRLNRTEVEQILHFIEKESKWVAKERAKDERRAAVANAVAEAKASAPEGGGCCAKKGDSATDVASIPTPTLERIDPQRIAIPRPVVASGGALSIVLIGAGWVLRRRSRSRIAA